MFLILALPRRWRNIRLSTSLLTSYPQLAFLSSDDAPMLESFAFRDRARGVTVPMGPFMFLGTKSLRGIAFEYMGKPCIFDSPVSRGSLTHLTTLSTTLSDTDAHRILRLCPRLETCRLAFRVQITALRVLGHPHEHISLLRLRYLFVNQENGVIDGPHFFDSIVLPALRSFHCNTELLLIADPLRCLFSSPSVTPPSRIS
ncbi:hypothetical protein MVEN_00786700 [Mycena venus]|uniref:Uncharacterized protein n=1 Tax=Mycena venus TaxID=2733690 RepID=A0A8H6YKW1_9AGAR|nr:hypothetical protein MVEN_00786700 [Mycena venus]